MNDDLVVVFLVLAFQLQSLVLAFQSIDSLTEVLLLCFKVFGVPLLPLSRCESVVSKVSIVRRHFQAEHVRTQLHGSEVAASVA